MEKKLDIACVADIIVKSDAKQEFQKKYMSCYEKNRQALNEYRFWRHGNLPMFDDLNISVCQTGEHEYVYFDKNEHYLSEVFEIHCTEQVTHPFFQDLKEPLLVRNEMNRYHWQYLYDNVRCSEDYGDDNHIYMYFDSLDKFLAFLQIEDITSCLLKEKMIFLFGEDDLIDNYPLSFSDYGIDYSEMECKPVRLDEIHRFFVNLHYFGSVGNDFIYGVLDYHKNLLTMGQRGLPEFSGIYKYYLYKKTPQVFKDDYVNNKLPSWINKALAIMFGDDNPIWTEFTEKVNPNKIIFFDTLISLWRKNEAPSEIEWFKLIYLSYAEAIGRKFYSRISPGIMINTHFNVRLPVEGDRWKLNFDLYSHFEYCKYIVPIRRPIVSGIRAAECLPIEKSGSISLFINRCLLEWGIRKLFLDENDPLKSSMKAVRFEDFKIHSKAMLVSLCEFFDIEWDDILFSVTYNGKEVVFDGTAGYDPAPVHRRYFEKCNPFDYYRIEVVMSKYWKHWGYKPLFYKEQIKYTEDDIIQMFKIPFQFEMYDVTKEAKENNIRERGLMNIYLKKRIEEGDVVVNKSGKKMVPISWLKPKAELLEGELYS